METYKDKQFYRTEPSYDALEEACELALTLIGCAVYDDSLSPLERIRIIERIIFEYTA